MRITIDPREVIVPAGEYGDEDDTVCKGCGREGIIWDNHNLLRCLQNIRDDYQKEISDLKTRIEALEK